MARRMLANTGLHVGPIGFGSFKLGRNQGIKYPQAYDLPDEAEAARVLNGVLDAGVDVIDTAPAYGLAEERIGNAIAHRRHEFTLCTKVGETFEDGRSVYDFSAAALRTSLERSLQRLKTDVLDVVLIHSDGRDLEIQHETEAVAVLEDFRRKGFARTIGLSGKTVEGARAALDWVDVLMVEYHLEDRSHEPVIAEAAARGVGVLVKKGLASGHLSPEAAIRFVLGHPAVGSLIVGGSNLAHLRSNLAVAENLRPAA